jgi:rare lipoprotein A
VVSGPYIAGLAAGKYVRSWFDLRRSSYWAALGLVAGIFVVSMTGTATARTTAPRQPVIDSAPKHLRYQGSGVLRGHLEGFIAGDELVLQRQRGDSWSDLATKPVDSEGRVRFDLSGLTRTRTFRLLWIDPTTEAETASESRRVTVAADLRFAISNDHVMQGRTVTVHGRLRPRGNNRAVTIQEMARGEWRYRGTAYVRDGLFALRFKARNIGRHRVRAVFKTDSMNTKVSRGAPLRVYDPALATWYGPGFYGNRTACGQRLGTETLGVAHRTLPCGTEVAVLYQGRTLLVPVIDRGPYGHADWDLTQETAERLRFSGKDTIGVDPVR